ncbi:hypothetical protein PPERSA_01007 [Pseudocohnilembus persalinus]|uniref:RING-type domain-containing protein n=1 Tax=Pseudocohnilembus persalinus TaxID=266149 RepID=A0A0V0QU56_PSEPJ|nr:hypothetical protein PPERSA_01007 [Pseudocohnilembus persalinus]|eukprot:KRX05929.1 hypothetical protein PPERSA_01007 [Pseudocohnilembus persalinus]
MFQWDSKYLQKSLDYGFSGWFKKIVCLLIVMQKLMTHALIMYNLYFKDISSFLIYSVYDIGEEQWQLIFIVNSFISYSCIERYIKNLDVFTPQLAKVCCFANIYIAFILPGFMQTLLPSLVFCFLFLLSCGIIVNIFNEDMNFETPFMDTLCMYTERLGAFCMSTYIYEIIRTGSFDFSYQTLGEISYIFISTNFMVTQFYYPEQIILRYIAVIYQRDVCAICLNTFKYDLNSILSLTDCYHVFHSDCLNKWLDQGKNNCPTCRQYFTE